MIDVDKFKIKLQPERQEATQLRVFLLGCLQHLSDDGPDCFVKRELNKIVESIGERIHPAARAKSKFTVTYNWYQLQALQYVFNRFIIPEGLPLAQTFFGKLDQALPLGFSMAGSG